MLKKYIYVHRLAVDGEPASTVVFTDSRQQAPTANHVFRVIMRLITASFLALLGAVIVLPLALSADDSEAAAISEASAASDAALRRGRIMFLQCRACHSTEADGEHRVGPNLHGVFGADAGSKDDFAYSDAMRASDIVWSDETLDTFLTKPTDYVPGTIMVFVGMEKAEDRQALIAYIRSQTE